MKRYTVLYRGVVAFSTNVHNKARSVAWEMAKAKGWDVRLIEIKDNLGCSLTLK